MREGKPPSMPPHFATPAWKAELVSGRTTTCNQTPDVEPKAQLEICLAGRVGAPAPFHYLQAKPR
jgi:hypothetical protein